jgi:hypothetical protein
MTSDSEKGVGLLRVQVILKDGTAFTSSTDCFQF